MIYIDVDTAVTVPVNAMPLTDDTDFKTRETAVAYNAAGMDLVWNFVTPNGTITQTAVTPTTGGVYDWSHIGDAMYKIEIPASGGGSINNDTEGVGYFTGVCTGVLPWRGPDICFRAAGLNDKLIESAYDANVGLSGSRLDATISSRNATTPPTTTAIRDAILDRVLNGNHDTAGTVGLLLQYLDEAVSAAKTLTSGERTTLAAAVAADILNDGDGTAVLQAIADQIAADWVAGDASPLAIVSAIKADSTLATMISRIDAAVSSRLASASYTTPPTVADIADGLWDEPIAGHLTAGSTGAALNAAGGSGDPWVTSLPGSYTSGQAGYIVGQFIDVAISSRNATTPPTANAIRDAILDRVLNGNHDTAGTVGLLLQYLDEAVSAAKTLTSGERTTLAAAVAADILNDGDGTAVLQAIADQIAADWVAGDASPLAIVSAIKADSTLATMISRIDAAVSSRLATAGYTTPPTVGAIAAEVDSTLTTAHGAGSWAAGGGLTYDGIADAVCDELLAGHTTPGSVGAALAAASAAGDPWATLLPGAYSPGSAGYIIGAGIPAIQASTGQITGEDITIAGPVQPGGEISVIVGDDYEDAISHEINRDVTDADQSIYDLLTDAAVTAVKFAAGYGKTGDVIVGTIDKGAITHVGGVTTIPIEIPSANLASADHLKAYTWQIQTTETGDRKRTVLSGPFTVAADMAL